MRATKFLFIVVCASACASGGPEPVPIPDPVGVVARLQEASAGPSTPQLIEFKWRYRDHDGRFTGDGGIRMNPPDSVRLDLLEPGGGGVQSAVMIGSEVRYIGEQRLQLPPATFIWAAFGMFRPPKGIVPSAAAVGERTRLTYGLTPDESVSFDFDAAGRMLEARRYSKGDAVQEIRLEVSESEGDDPGHAWPRSARFRDLVQFIEIRVEVVESSDHDAFEGGIFEVAPR